uniref:SRCR domain-containing protein n=1 Tax=Lates calcarifer TaxID=8187 RepID=A0A4W6EAY8_LATCA
MMKIIIMISENNGCVFSLSSELLLLHMDVSFPIFSSGLWAEGNHQSTEPVRLVGGASRCAGTLQVKRGEWRPVDDFRWTLKDSVRLVNGTSLCSGRLEVKTHQSNQWWSSVCEADFDLQDAEVVCRELGCGAPSVLQGALYGEVEAPVWTKEFQCGGQESALLDCRSSGSARTTCSPGKAVGLTCSEPVRLVGGASRCAGTLQVKLGEWRPVADSDWTLKAAAVVCRQLDCGSAVSTGRKEKSSERFVWWIRRGCVQSGYDLRECLSMGVAMSILEVTCSGKPITAHSKTKTEESTVFWQRTVASDLEMTTLILSSSEQNIIYKN